MVFRHDVAYTHEAGASPRKGWIPDDMLTGHFLENIVSTLRDVFASRDISVSFDSIPRTLSPSTAATSLGPVAESDNHIGDANHRLTSSEDIVPILYVGPSSLGLTNLLMTHPTTPVRTPFPSPFAHHLVDGPFPLLIQGPRVRSREARGHGSVYSDQ